MEYESRKASPDVLKLRYMYVYIYIYIIKHVCGRQMQGTRIISQMNQVHSPKRNSPSILSYHSIYI